MEVKELGHVVLYVRDLERSAAFYGDLLGWRRIPGRVPGMPAVAFTSGRTHHELLLIEVGPSAAELPRGRRVGMYHVGLKIGESDDELVDALREIEDSGVTLVGTADHVVTHSLYVLDPDGNEVELYVDVAEADWRRDPALMMSPTRPLEISR